MDDVLHIEVDDAGVALVVLNRPAARNALNSLLLGGLRASLQTLEEREDVRAIVLTGADPAFCAGLDLKELSAEILARITQTRPALSSYQHQATPAISSTRLTEVFDGLQL